LLIGAGSLPSIAALARGGARAGSSLQNCGPLAVLR
jgi:hypothetical protein